MLGRYRDSDLKDCLGGKQVVLIGDSTMRQLYWALARKIDPDKAYQAQHTSERHSNMLFQKDDLSVNFIWDPFLSSSVMYGHLASASAAERTPGMKSTSAIIMIGAGLWHARYLQGAAVQRFSQTISNLTDLLKSTQSTMIDSQSTLKILSPVQIPYYDILSEERRRHINPSSVEAMNRFLHEDATKNGVLIPFAFQTMYRDHLAAYDMSGLHVQESVADRMTDLILNIKCNANLSKSQSYPMDKTCCSTYARPNWTQSILLTFSMGLVLCLILLHVVKLLSLSRGSFPVPQIVKAVAILMAACCYCCYADRTQLWNKAQKEFDSRQFTTLCALPFLLSILTIRKSRMPAKDSKIQSKPDQPFLSRDQTDEWKGWLQVIILAYHYTGASKVLRIYQLIRLLVASYLFMTGFGHAVYYCERADYSLSRVASVLLRLNMLSVLLPYFMKTDYIFYYFAPLTTFWFLVIYLTMFWGHKRNHDIRFLLSKVFVSAAIVNLSIKTPILFEWTFEVLKRTCRIHWDVHEWRFRLQLDSYIVYVGMLCGIVFARATVTSIADHQPDGHTLNHWIKRHTGKIRLFGASASLLTLFVSYELARQTPNKFVYNRYVPYTSFVPILAFVCLRNASPTLRKYHSEAFAWIGRISLETFTLQFHVWLAADTKGLLRTGLFQSRNGDQIEMIIITIVFLWLSHKVADATQILTQYIVDPATSGAKHSRVGKGMDEATLPNTEKEGQLINATVSRSTWVRTMIGGFIAQNPVFRLVLILIVLWALNMVSTLPGRRQSVEADFLLGILNRKKILWENL